MEKQGKFGSDWVEGFAKAAMAAGANAAQVKHMLKVAGTLEQLRDPDFVEGIAKVAEANGMSKEAIFGGLSRLILGKPGAGALRGALGGAGALGAGLGAHELWKRWVGRGAGERRFMDLMDLAEQGKISYEDAIGHGRNIAMRGAEDTLGTMGARRQMDPYGSWYNFG